MLSGYFSALVTPFDARQIDFESFDVYLRYIIKSGVAGFVVCGSTGESLSLSFEEKIALIKKASFINSGNLKIIAGVIEASTDSALEIIKETEDFVDGFLCICPYYVKPSQKQIYEHLFTLSEATKKDIIIYNNPGRVGTSINFDVLNDLVNSAENIIAIKECDVNLNRFCLWRTKMKKEFSFLTGNDDTAAAALAFGALGVISVTANIAPALCVQMFDSLKHGDLKTFFETRDKLAELHQLMFQEPSPAPLKYALSRLGLMKPDVRRPLAEISSSLKYDIDICLKNLRICDV